ncbi:hypothetical protein [Pseudomonas gingeri]|uniref:hypothetical protein n=1 Tax=Pseudomonas gingeri TaxID=117681 RepID=UPI0015A02C52|nr:hypothetical protein [Pseudomonas gingeri]NWA05606.1 hypothetical protein [Pseudomonas gingeri]
MNKGGYLCLAFMVIVGSFGFFLQPEAVGLSFALIALFSGSYFVFFLIRNNFHHGILRSLLLSIVILAIGFIPVLGWIVLIGFVIYNISKALGGLKSLLPDVLASLMIYGLLGARVLFDIKDPIAIVALSGTYLVAAILYCRSLNGLTTHNALFKMSIMWLSIPFAVLTVMSIISALGNLFRTVGSTISRTVVTPQIVSAHMRAGVPIDSYTRNVTSTITTATTQIVPGSGVFAAALAGEVVPKATQEKD